MSEAIHESGQSSDPQETISDNSLVPEILENETCKNLTLDELQTFIGFSGNPDFLDLKCYLESSKSDCYSSDSNDINSPAICDNNPQMKKKRKMSEALSVSDNFGVSEKNLERSDKYDSRSKFTSGTTISENPLNSQDQKISEKTSDALTVLIHNAPLLASDNTNSNTSTNNRPSMAVGLGVGTGKFSRNLCPRQHMDKLSEYYFKILIKNK